MISLSKDRKSPMWIITTTDSEGFHRQLNVSYREMECLCRLWEEEKEEIKKLI